MTKLQVNGASVFHSYWVIWKFIGQLRDMNRSIPYYIYALLLNIIITVCYPLHLILGLFHSKTYHDIFQNITITTTCLSCSIKTLLLWWYMDDVRKIMDIITKLDRKIKDPDEVEYYERVVIRTIKRILYFFYLLCFAGALSAEAGVVINGVLNGKWGLMYPGYFPFDYENSLSNYMCAHFYQFFGISLHIAQNAISDTIGGAGLAMLGGHIHLLGMRIAKIGFNTQQEKHQRQKQGQKVKSEIMAINNTKLVDCIEDYKLLLKFHTCFERAISWGTFVQIIFTSLTICDCIVFLMFYIDNIASFVHYIVYMLAVPLEIFPCCYYGHHALIEFDKLTYSLFSCNWIDQDRKFKQNLRIFTEQTLKKRNLLAGKMIYINLDTFFATAKIAYSLFAVININNK